MNEQELQLQIVLLVLAAISGDQLASLQIQQIMQAAQQGDQLAAQIALMIQAVALQMQGQQAQMAKKGAKLDYIKKLRGQCPEGLEMGFYKVGGKVCRKCIKKQLGGEIDQLLIQDPIEAYKKGRRVKKAASGDKIPPFPKNGTEAEKKAHRERYLTDDGVTFIDSKAPESTKLWHYVTDKEILERAALRKKKELQQLKDATSSKHQGMMVNGVVSHFKR